MKRFLKKFGFALLVVSIVLTCLWAAAGAYSVPAEKRALLPSQVIYVPGPMDPNQQIRSVQTQTEPLQIVPMAQEEYLSDITEAGAVLREKMKNREETVTILCAVDAGMDLNALVDAITDAAVAHTGVATEGDYLQWQYGGMSYSIGGYTDGVTNYYTLECTIFYYTTADQEAMVDAAVEKLWADLAVDGMTDYEKLCAVYDWMCANITYDYDNLNDDAYDLKYTAYAALVDRTSVCQGYAVLLYRLMLEQGIDCRVITGIGNGGPHAWNIVALDGQYYNLDATWDATWHQAGLEYNFFLRSNATFEDHERESVYSTDEFNAAYPMSEADYAPVIPCEHDWYVLEVVEPTCTDGYTVYMCSYCGEQYCDDFVPGAGEHAWDVFDVIVPTCKDGYTVYMCSLCGEMREDDYVTAVFTHDWGEWVVYEEPTCGTVGWQMRTCSYCYCEEVQEIAQTDHTFLAEVVEPTCQSQGYTVYTCSYCGICYDDNYVPSVDHNYESVVVPPTCTEEGYTIHTCTMCGLWYKTDFKNPMEWSPWVIVTAPTTEEEGLALRECPVCNELEQKVLPKKQPAVYILDLAKAFEETLNPIDYFGGYLDPFFMATFTNEILLEGFEYTDYLCVPAAEYEAVLNRYFAVDAATLDEIRNSCVTYSASQQTYTICWLDGVEVGLPGGKMVGYVKNGDVYEVYYGNAHYAHLQDALPDGVDMYEYASGLGWPDTIEYDGVVYESYYDTYIGVIGVENYGNKYTVEVNNLSTVRVLSSADGYVAEDLPEHLHLHLPETAAPNCTQFGYTNYVCACGETNEGSYVDPLGHSFADGVCTRCGEVESEKNYCGDNLTWVLSDEGILTISGTGAMWDFYSMADCPWYSFTNQIVHIVINEGVTSIGAHAFENFTNLQGIVIADSVKSIGQYAFSGCTSLSGVVMPAVMTDIGFAAFSGCTSLESIVLPQGLTELSGNLFYGCTSLRDVVLFQGITTIGNAAFQECVSLTSIVLPEGVTTIGNYAFNCSGLTDITLFQGVTTIGDAAFSKCQGLTGIVLPDSVTTIGNEAFSGCTGFSSIELPKNLTSLGEYAFWGCTSLESVVTPDTMSTIGFAAFSGCSNLRSIVIPQGVTVINGDLFYGCTSLESVTIPQGVTSIGSSAFQECTSLTSIVLPEGVTEIGSSAFLRCSNLADIVMAQSITSIGRYAFAECTSLKSIVIPEGVTEIGERAFEQCSSLEAIVLPDSVTAVGQWAFVDCVNMRTAVIGNGVTTIADYAFYHCEGLTDVTIGNSLENIGVSAFAYCYSLTKITLPATATNIGDQAFSHCSSMTSINIPDGVVRIGRETFMNCDSLVEIVIPDSVTTLGEWSFYSCEGLTSITIGSGVTKIEWVSFLNCTSLQAVYISDIAAWCAIDFADYQCNPLHCAKNLYLNGQLVTDLVIPESVTAISKYAFYGCESLTSVTIPSGVTCIAERTFALCKNLTTIILPDSVTSLDDQAFYSCSGLTEITIPGTVTSIGRMTFAYCSGLTEIIIPASVTSLGDYAFESCTGLTSMVIPETVTSLGVGLFNWCHGLTQVTLPSHLTSIGAYMFNECTSLTDITIPDGVQSIGDCAFGNCASLSSITIPASVTSIEFGAFQYCGNLTDIQFLGDAPGFFSNVFEGVTATCYYPVGNATWTDDVKQDYGGTITWQPICAGEHTYETAITAPTCVDQGYTAHICSVCGYSYKDTYTDALGHDMGEWILDLAPTCMKVGSEHRNCSRCDYSETRETSLGEHVYDAVVSAPSCEYQGYTTHTCTVCGNTYMDSYTDPLGHDMGQWEQSIAPDCTRQGEERRFCSRCGYTEYRALEPTGHKYESEVVEPTCNLEGYTFYTCSVCGHHYADNYTDRLPHNYDGFVSVSPTCETDGEMFYICYDCGDSYTEVIPATGHTSTHIENQKDATCGTDGYTGDTVCDACGKVLEYGQPIYASGQHNYTSQVTMEPGCLTNGVMTYTCTACGDSYTVEIIATGHGIPYIQNEKAATCLEDGYSGDEVCSDCGEIVKYGSAIPAVGHQYTTVNAAEPTCGADGYTGDTVCANCGYVSATGQTIPATGQHSYIVTVIIEPTCDFAGLRSYYCPGCYDEYTEEIPAKGHTFKTEILAPTCYSEGYTTYTCTECSYYYIGDFTERTPHSFETVTTPPTCTEDGYNSYRCTVCGDGYGETIPATGHRNTTVIDRSEATCGWDGYSGDTRCDDCGMIIAYGSVIPRTDNHSFTQWSTIVEPTEYSEGLESRECTACGLSETRAIPMVDHVHDYHHAVTVVAPTCTQTGYTIYECRCGDSYIADEVAALGHSVQTAYGFPATCTADGLTDGEYCSACGEVLVAQTIIPAFGHTEVIDAAVAPTCTESGLTEGKHCAVCGEITLAQTVVDALGHSYGQWYTVKAPGEYEDGLEQRDCANCGAAETRVIPAVGHTHNYVGVGTAPTCTEPGYTTYTCTGCGDSYIADEVPASGHAEVVVPGAAPSCTEDGLTDGKYCIICGETTLAQTVIPALGHTEVIIEGVAPTCTESGLTEGKYCDRCGEIKVVQQEIPAIGHNYISTVIAPTCTEMGYTIHSCTNCGASYTSDQVDALGHKHEAVVTAPTCTEGGYTTYTCHCGDSYVAEKTEQTGHSWDAGVVTIAPTTQSEGEKICTCTACGETRREVLPVLPDVVYDIPEDETVTIPDNYCFEDGTTVKVEEVTEVETVETVTEVMETVAEKYVAYEFTATKEDAPVQPSGKLTVTFAIPADYSNNVTVYYMAENGKLTELDAVVDSEARTVTVELEHFSTYIVVDQDSAPTVLMGDVNGDGRVNVRDARTILRYIAGLIDASELDLDAADFNGDTRINVRDARAILRDIAGLD